MVITVTEHDIKLGRSNSPDACPVALALKRAYGKNYKHCTVSMFGIGVRDINGFFHSCRLVPLPIMNFIDKFDRGYPVEPFESVLNLD